MSKTVLLIPSLHPDGELLTLLSALRDRHFEQIIVIDDGSGENDRPIFQSAARQNCMVVTHAENRGKGAALKTGIRAAIERFGAGNAYVIADADGQHLPEDIRRVADALEAYPASLILGTRDFSLPNVPWKSRFGNRITSALFHLTSGIACPDTQTGLRGIPSCLETLALTEEGDRYEYEMNFLSDAAGRTPIVSVPIQTVYLDNNRASHFRPLADSALIYGRFLRYVGASVAGAVTDFALFYLFASLLALPQTETIFLATALARICSGVVNFLLNRYWSFHSRMPAGAEAVRYGVLFLCQMGVSAALVSFLAWLLLPELAAKVIVDTGLFFLSFTIQKNWVFRKEAAA
jgi:glycosyltransferase involved in cell wall biosynthesis